MGTTRSKVIFNNTFKLRAFTELLPPGTYEISVLDKEAQGATNQGAYNISTMICTPCIERQGGAQKWTGVNANELAEALQRDARTITLRKPATGLN